MNTTRSGAPARDRRAMSPPTPIVSSSGWGAKTMTRGRAGSASGATAGSVRAAVRAGGAVFAATAVGAGATRWTTTAVPTASPANAASAARLRIRPPTSGLKFPPPTPGGSDLVALHEAAGDHKPLDLVRALADDHEGRVAVVALDAELLRVAVAAEDAHRLERDLLAGLRREQLRHARLEVT